MQIYIDKKELEILKLALYRYLPHVQGKRQEDVLKLEEKLCGVVNKKIDA